MEKLKRRWKIYLQTNVHTQDAVVSEDAVMCLRVFVFPPDLPWKDPMGNRMPFVMIVTSQQCLHLLFIHKLTSVIPEGTRFFIVYCEAVTHLIRRQLTCKNTMVLKMKQPKQQF